MPHRVRDTPFSLSPEPEIARTASKQRDTKGQQNQRKSCGAMQAMAGPTIPEEFLKAENVGLRMLLEQAGLDARALLAQAGIEASCARPPTGCRSSFSRNCTTASKIR